MIQIPHSYPWLDNSDVASVISTLNEEIVGFSDRLENLIGIEANKYIDKKHFQTVTSGSLALFLILRYLDLESDRNHVVMPSIDCWSVYNTVKYAGYEPILCDVRSTADFRSNYDNIKRCITKDTGAIIITHMFGCLIEIDIIDRLKSEFPSIVIIEDYASSFGALYNDGSRVGGNSDYVIGSFGSTKQITGGVGGIIASDHDVIKRDYDNPISDRELLINQNLSAMNQALLLSQLIKLPTILNNKALVLGFYNSFTEVYGMNESQGLYRAITFYPIDKILKYLSTHSVSMEIHNSVQPNLAKCKNSIDNYNAINFKSYKSLPLNKVMYYSLKNIGIIQ